MTSIWRQIDVILTIVFSLENVAYNYIIDI